MTAPVRRMGKVNFGYEAMSQCRRTNCIWTDRRFWERPASVTRRIAAAWSWRSGAAENRSRGWAFRSTVVPFAGRRVGMVGFHLLDASGVARDLSNRPFYQAAQ